MTRKADPQGRSVALIAPDADVARSVRAGLDGAYATLLEGYAQWGGWRYHGWTNQADRRNYYGPAIWSEADCAHRFALALERTFPNQVHCQTGVNRALFAEYVPAVDPRQAIDIVVSDPAGLVEGDNAQETFRTKCHEAFVEVKWLKKGRWTKLHEHRSRADGITKDLLNLQKAIQRGRCVVAGMLIFDDECALDLHPELVEWLSSIERLVVSPSELARRDLGDDELQRALIEIEANHKKSCACRRGARLSSLASG